MMSSKALRTASALLACALAIPVSAAAQEKEGVRVRGHWVVEVHNPDGTLVERREFDNALVPGGQQLLAQYLTGSAPARWVVELGVYGGSTAICNGGTYNTFPQNYCLVVDKTSSPMPTGTSVFPTLTSAIGGPSSNEVVLKGSATALVDGQIQYVATRQGSCGTFTAPASCAPAGTVLQFTVHDITPTPLSVAAGQIVQFTVNLGFF
jgi:hypothetical protein